MAVCVHAEEVVKHARMTRNGVKAAAKSLMRRFLPPTADPASLVEAAFSGVLVGDVACSVSSLATSTKAKVWLGVPAATGDDVALPLLPVPAQHLQELDWGIE